MTASTIQWIAAFLFAGALIHTFSASYFEKLAHHSKHHSGLFHLLGEVEAVFGIWALFLIIAMAFAVDLKSAVEYVDTRHYTEPLFVFVIMVVAASRPVLDAARMLVEGIAKLMPLAPAVAFTWLGLFLVPLLGSFITEPAAMTLAALLLRDVLFAKNVPNKIRYLGLGVLFVNISIGGVLTNFAAPPVLMVASTWGWSTAFMMQTFGWKAAIAVFINATVFAFYAAKHLTGEVKAPEALGENGEKLDPVPWWAMVIHLLFLLGVVVFAHHPAVFLGLFLFFLGFTVAYNSFQTRLLLKEGLLVAFFLAGLVVLGGMQQWWLQPAVSDLNDGVLFVAAMALTAITDNAALTYLGSLIEGTSESFRYALVAGAVAGGGLTVIANAPNPAGLSLLKRQFPDEAVSAGGLLAGALLPTAVAAAAFYFL
ncbi:putative Na+/H+ antiporter [Limnobacter sp.]|uniref:putative Na+/H+ antiporter n=1 Tax=Limnobacter sp. TaxID=2003368 RepID=UPI003511B78C